MSLMLYFIVSRGTLCPELDFLVVHVKIVDHFIYMESREAGSYFMHLSWHDGLFWANKLSCHFLASCFSFDLRFGSSFSDYL